MSNDIDEDMKNKIAAKYKEITQKDTISDFCNQEGISETTFHKYKEHEAAIQESIETDVEEGNTSKSFEVNYTPDKKEKPEKKENEDEDETEDEDEPEDVELTIG